MSRILLDVISYPSKACKIPKDNREEMGRRDNVMVMMISK